MSDPLEISELEDALDAYQDRMEALGRENEHLRGLLAASKAEVARLERELGWPVPAESGGNGAAVVSGERDDRSWPGFG